MTAQTVKEHYLQGTISDYITNIPLDYKTTVELIASDSVTIISSGRIYESRDKRKKLMFTLPVTESGDYVIRCKNEKYHTLLLPIKVKLHKRETYIQTDPLRMKKKLVTDSINLDGIVVTATKIKFYFDNDTLIYNAEPFVTQEGFVLANILNKMPGIEIKENGDVYSNGRLIKTLLLNGKDFFNNDRATLLENLPAYMVKNVKIYEKEVDSTAIIERERHLAGMTMDIRLKKAFSNFLIGNTDIGMSTDLKYYGKLFGLESSEIHRISMYAISNNINKNETLFQNGTAKDTDHGVGIRKNTKAGMNYNLDDTSGKYYLEGNIEGQYVDEYYDTKTNTQTFLTSGDKFLRSVKNENRYKASISTNHSFYLCGNTPYDFTIKPNFSYERNKMNQDLISGAFLVDIDSLLPKSWTDSLRMKELSQFMKIYGLNKQHLLSNISTNQLTTSLTLDKKIKIPHTNDVLSLQIHGYYMNLSETDNNFYNICYIQNKEIVPDIRNKYDELKINKWGFEANALYQAKLTETSSLNFSYKFIIFRGEENAPKYLLHELGLIWNDELYFDQIPSQDILETVKDKGESYCYTTSESKHAGEVKYIYNKKMGNKPETFFSVSLPFNYLYNKMDYRMDSKNMLINRNGLLPEIAVDFSMRKFKFTNGFSYSASYSMTQNMPSLLYMIDRTTEINPLYIKNGNPNLNNTISHNLKASVFKQNNMNYHTLSLNYTYLNDAISESVLYNTATGGIETTPINVKGNNTFNLLIMNHWYTKKNKTGVIGNEINMTINNSSEFIGITQEEVNKKSSVCNFNIKEKMSYEKSYNKIKFSFDGYMTFYHSTSERKTFNTINCYNFGFDASGNIELHKNINFSTSIKSVSRRGYNYSDMNDDEFIWNASLSKSFSEKVSLKLDVNDILSQRKSVYRSVNALCRTEVFNNNLRRYIMLHFLWKFDVSHTNKH